MVIVTKFLRFCCRQATVEENTSTSDDSLRSNLGAIADELIE
jgi:hypothetical protein